MEIILNILTLFLAILLSPGISQDLTGQNQTFLLSVNFSRKSLSANSVFFSKGPLKIF